MIVYSDDRLLGHDSETAASCLQRFQPLHVRTFMCVCVCVCVCVCARASHTTLTAVTGNDLHRLGPLSIDTL